MRSLPRLYPIEVLHHAARRLVAGASLARVVGGLEAGTAGATLGGLWVEDGEPALHEIVDVVNLSAPQQRCAVGIDEDSDAGFLDQEVSLFLFLRQRHAVLVAGAAAADDENAQCAGAEATRLQKILGLLGGAVGNRNDSSRLGRGNLILEGEID